MDVPTHGPLARRALLRSVDSRPADLIRKEMRPRQGRDEREALRRWQAGDDDRRGDGVSASRAVVTIAAAITLLLIEVGVVAWLAAAITADVMGLFGLLTQAHADIRALRKK